MARSTRLWVCAFLTSVAQTSLAQESLPTDIELRAAYCIPIVKWQLGISQQTEVIARGLERDATTPSEHKKLSKVYANTRKSTAAVELTLHRLQSYLLPRIQLRDPVALAAAQGRGEADLRELQNATEHCTTQCAGPEHETECFESCVGKPLVARMRACLSASWLPF
jgi:hypothetical protein